MLRLLIETCVHRRAAALFATLVVAAFGLHAYLDTPIEAYPDVTNTQVTVITQLPGNAPEEIERRVTVPLERELNGTPGMTLMRSESLFGLSLITLTFSDDTDSFPARTVSCSASPPPSCRRARSRSSRRRPRRWARSTSSASPATGTISTSCAPRCNGTSCACCARRRASPTSCRSAAISRNSTSRPTRRACSRWAYPRRPRAGDRQVQRQRRRRLPAPRRSGADGPRPRLPRVGRGHQAHRAEEQGRHAGHHRRRRRTWCSPIRRGAARSASGWKRRASRASSGCGAARIRPSCSTASTPR